jgi:transposase
VFCAVLYLLRTGGQWRFLPSAFPKWRTVHSYFAKWSEPDQDGISVLERALKKSGWRGPHAIGAQRLHETVLIADAQSVKNTDTAVLEGDDAGKKLCGIKRYIVVDTQGFSHAVAVTTAGVTDHNGALPAMNRCKANLGKGQSVLADSGSMGQPFAQAVKEALGEEGHGADCQALGCGAQFFLVEQEQVARQERREKARHQPAVHSLGVPRSVT